MHAPGHHLGQRLGDALERHVHDVDLRHRLEDLAGEVRAATHAGGGKVDAPGIRPRFGEELLQRGDLEGRPDDQDILRAAGLDDAGKIPGLVRQLRVDGRGRRVRRRNRQQRVAVGGRARDLRRGERSSGAGPVLDQHLLPERLGQALRNVTRGDVGSAARSETDHNADRSTGKVLR